MAKKQFLDVVVEKKRWYRGQGSDDSALLLAKGAKMCCIGFLARTCGVKPKEMRGISDVALLPRIKDEGLPYQALHQIFKQEGYNLEAAYRTNDNRYVSEAVRIKQLKILGRKLGVNFTFGD